MEEWRKYDPDKMVVAFNVYRNGVVEVTRRGTPASTTPGIRSEIVKFTQRARDKMLFTASATEVIFKSMITLTYPESFPIDGKRVKMDLKVFRQRMVREYGCEILWFLEFQKRGAPHFHLLTTVKEPNMSDRKKLAYMWADVAARRPSPDDNLPAHERHFAEYAKIWRVHAHSRSWEAIREVNGAVRYAAKYATKTRQKEVPEEYKDVGQFWGCSKLVRDTARPIAVVDANSRQIRDILEAEGHRVAEFDWLPRYIWGVEAVQKVDKT